LAPSQVTVAAPVLVLALTEASPTVESRLTFLVHIVPANAGSGLARDAWLNLTLPSALVYVSDSSDGQRTVIGSRISWHWQDWPTGPRPFDLALAANPTTPDGANASVPMSLTSVDANGNHGPDVPVV